MTITGEARLISNLHKIVRKDPYVIELCKSTGIEIDVMEALLQDIYNQYFFDTMTWGADILAKQMNITFGSSMTQSEKNSLVEARYKNNGKADVEFLQSIADSWKNGEIKITFENGIVKVNFIGAYGVPTDLENLKSELDKAKPAHLFIDYLYSYLLIKDIHNVMTIDELQTKTLSQFAF